MWNTSKILNLLIVTTVAFCSTSRDEGAPVSSEYKTYQDWFSQQVSPVFSALPRFVPTTRKRHHCSGSPYDLKSERELERTADQARILGVAPVGRDERGRVRFDFQIWDGGQVYCLADNELTPTRGLDILIELGRQDGLPMDGEAERFYFFVDERRYFSFRNIDPVSGELSNFFFLFESGKMVLEGARLRLCPTGLLTSTSESPPRIFWDCLELREIEPDFGGISLNPQYRFLEPLETKPNREVARFRYFSDSKDPNKIFALLSYAGMHLK